MTEEQLYKESFLELSKTLLDSMQNNAMLKAQAEFYASKYNELLEENTKLKSENEEFSKQLNKNDISDSTNMEENK